MSDQPLRIRRSTGSQPEDLLILDSVDSINGNGSSLSFINTSDLESGLSLSLGRIGARRVDEATVQLDLGIATDPSFSSNTETVALLSLVNGGVNQRRVETPADSTLAAGGALNVSGPTSLGGTLGVTGSTTLGGGLNVSGATTLGGGLGVSGNVGIGIAEPTKTLDVAGQAVFRSAAWTGASAGVVGTTVGFDAGNAGGTGFVFAHDTNGLSTRLWLDGDPLIFAPRGVERVRISSSGLALAVNGDFGRDDAPATLHLWSSRIGDVGGGTLFLRSGGGVVAFDGGDNVGIGLNAPRTPLHVLGRISTGLDFTSAGAITFFPPDGFAWFHIDNGPAGGRPIGRLRVSFGGNPGDFELMSFLQNGNIGIGNPSPQMKLHLSQGWLRIGGNNHDLVQLEAGNNTDRSTFRFDTNYLSFWTPQVGDFLVMRRDGSVEFRGRLIAGQKTGFVVDQFVNNLGEPLEQGDVLIIGDTQSTLSYTTNGHIPVPEVDLARQAYDSRVCGIVSEAYADPTLNPATADPAGESPASSAQRTLTLSDSQLLELGTTIVHPGQIGFMVTLGAFAYCKVDADIAPINPGDLLTTSPTPGHAQKVLDRSLAPGAIIGKALEPLAQGKGKIPIMVLLQ